MYAAIDFQDGGGGGIMLLVKMSCEERCLSFHAGHFVCAEKKMCIDIFGEHQFSFHIIY